MKRRSLVTSTTVLNSMYAAKEDADLRMEILTLERSGEDRTEASVVNKFIQRFVWHNWASLHSLENFLAQRKLMYKKLHKASDLKREQLRLTA